MDNEKTARNKAICDYYLAGHKITECAEQFGLDRQRVHQILKKAGVWQAYQPEKSRRVFLGVNVTEDTRAKLPALARKHGRSVSRFVSDILDAVVNNKAIAQ
jgi:hypothetical protein